MELCQTAGVKVFDHFRKVTKMLKLGSGAKRNVKEYMLRIDCNKAEEGLRRTLSSQYALNALALDNPLEYARASKNIQQILKRNKIYTNLIQEKQNLTNLLYFP